MSLIYSVAAMVAFLNGHFLLGVFLLACSLVFRSKDKDDDKDDE